VHVRQRVVRGVGVEQGRNAGEVFFAVSVRLHVPIHDDRKGVGEREGREQVLLVRGATERFADEAGVELALERVHLLDADGQSDVRLLGKDRRGAVEDGEPSRVARIRHGLDALVRVRRIHRHQAPDEQLAVECGRKQAGDRHVLDQSAVDVL
jgi:hypothetical protein